MKIFDSNVTQDEKLEFIKYLFVKDIIYRNVNFRKVSVTLHNFLHQLGIINVGHNSEIILGTLKSVENHNRVVVYFNINDSDDDANQTVAVSVVDNMQWKDAVNGLDESENGLCIVYAYHDNDQHCWNFMAEGNLRHHAKMFVQSLRNTVKH